MSTGPRGKRSPYIELHCHSAYSFLDGTSLPEELAVAACERGYSAMALTDHDSLAGSMEWAQSAPTYGVRPLHGAELSCLLPDVDAARHLTLLVMNACGWRNLCRIITRAHRDTRVDLRRPRAPAVPLEFVLEHAEGLICLSGCASHGVEDEETMRRLLEGFASERLRVELQRPFLRHDRARNRAREALARRLGLRCVATGDVHAHTRRRALLQDAFVAARHHLTLEASEPLRRGNHGHTLTSPEKMAARFVDHPEAVLESALVAEMLEFKLDDDLGYQYPRERDASAQHELAELCHARLEDHYRESSSRMRHEARVRMEQELRLIEQLRLAGFFLLHHQMLMLAREVAVEVRGPGSVRSALPPGRGRGSSVSSLVCFLTGLSHVDPVENELAIGRFLNEELSSVPDIDLDFPRDIREVLIPRVHDHFGRDRAALVASYPSFRSRAAIRELGKVLGLPPGEIERVARASEGFVPGDWSHGDRPFESPSGVAGDIVAALGADRVSSSRWEWLARLAAEARGLPRHLSQHPGGMIISTQPLIDCCPIVPAAMAGRQMVQWDKDSCADARFLKIDLLGLGMLSAVERCVELVERTRGKRIDFSRLPYDDEPTFAAIQVADTVGVFQIESRAQMQSLLRTRPRTLKDLTIQVAIVRPGPIQGGAVNPYIERLQKQRADPSYEVPYLHPSLKDVLQETLGTIIFQDQVMEVSQAFAGFSPGQADSLRRAMSRKRAASEIEKLHQSFVEGARRHSGAEAVVAERIWEMVAGFAGFGFPKAHSAAFALLAYQSTWLRVHYGPEFLCALLNEQPMGFYAPDSLVHEAARRGLTLLPADVNASEIDCTVDCNLAVRLGLRYIKDVSRDDIESLVAAREADGPFHSLGDLAARAGVGRAALEQLAWSGACDRVGGAGGSDDSAATGSPAPAESSRRRTALWQLGVVTPGRGVPSGTQLALPLDPPGAPALRPLGRLQQLLAEYATTGVTLSGHVMEVLRPRLPDGILRSAQLAEASHGMTVTVAGLVIARQRPGTASGLVFMLLEDESGTANLIIPSALYERQRALVRSEPLLLAVGRLEKLPAAGGAINVLVSGLRALESALAPSTPVASVHSLPLPLTPAAESPDAEIADPQRVGAGIRAVAPPVSSFAAGRRR